jgi:hypothetical protein
MLHHINQYKEANVCEKYKFIWIGPERVGSRSTAKIFTFCGFTCRGRQMGVGNAHNYTHNSEIPPQYKDYKIICSARNPYSRTLSLYKNFTYSGETGDDRTFREYVLDLTCGKPETKFVDGVSKYNTFINPVLERQPDYVVRLENIYEDLSKIPFIFNHLTKSQLEMMCEHGKPIDEWESHYDQEMKDLVYQHLKHQFDMWGYDK